MIRNKLQIGVVGGGMIADAHMGNFVKDGRTQLRWLAETNTERLNEKAKKYSVPNATTDYREMLKDEELDAVIVCTPPWLHVKMGVDVMKAGKHLLMEKPLATTVADALTLLAEARRHPHLKVSGCSCRHARLNPKFHFVKKMIDDGKLGDVYFVHHRGGARQGRPGVEYNPGATWFLDRKLAGGGPLYDWGVYDLSFHLGLLGEPRFIKAEAFCRNGLDLVKTGAPVFTVEEHGAAWLKFAGGLSYFWERSSNAHNAVPPQTAIYGTRGGLRFGFCTWDPPEIEYFYVDRGGRGKARSKTYPIDMSSHKGDMPALGEAFIAYLLGKGPVPMPLELEVKNLKIIHAVYAAAGWKG